MTEPAYAEKHAIAAWPQEFCGPLGGAVGGDAGIGQRRHLDRRDVGIELDQRALAGDEVFGEAAIHSQARELAVVAVHVLAVAAVEADAAGAERMADHGVAALDRPDAAADLLDPAGIFVT